MRGAGRFGPSSVGEGVVDRGEHVVLVDELGAGDQLELAGSDQLAEGIAADTSTPGGFVDIEQAGRRGSSTR